MTELRDEWLSLLAQWVVLPVITAWFVRSQLTAAAG